MGLNTSFQEPTNIVKNKKIDWSIAKDSQSKTKKDNNKKKDDNPPHQFAIVIKTALTRCRVCGEKKEQMPRSSGPRSSSCLPTFCEINLISRRTRPPRHRLMLPLIGSQGWSACHKGKQDLGVISPLCDLQLVDHVLAYLEWAMKYYMTNTL